MYVLAIIINLCTAHNIYSFNFLERNLSSSDIDLKNPAEFLCPISSTNNTMKGNSTIGNRTAEKVSMAFQEGNIFLSDAITAIIKRLKKEIL